MLRIAAAFAVAIVVAVLAVLLLRDGPSVGAALTVLDDDARFTTARRAAEAFIETSQILQVTAIACSDDCSPMFEASAYAQVLAFEVVDCTLPGVHDARQALIAYLERVDEGDADVQPPSLPDC